jgi:hypothetical protein
LFSSDLSILSKPSVSHVQGKQSQSKTGQQEASYGWCYCVECLSDYGYGIHCYSYTSISSHSTTMANALTNDYLLVSTHHAASRTLAHCAIPGTTSSTTAPAAAPIAAAATPAAPVTAPATAPAAPAAAAAAADKASVGTICSWLQPSPCGCGASSQISSNELNPVSVAVRGSRGCVMPHTRHLQVMYNDNAMQVSQFGFVTPFCLASFSCGVAGHTHSHCFRRARIACSILHARELSLELLMHLSVCHTLLTRSEATEIDVVDFHSTIEQFSTLLHA